MKLENPLTGWERLLHMRKVGSLDSAWKGLAITKRIFARRIRIYNAENDL